MPVNKIQNYFQHTTYYDTDLLRAGAGPMADISGPVSDKNRESSEASGTVGVDA